MVSDRLTDDVLLIQNRTIPSGEIDDELMALDAQRGEILGLDKIGTEVWRLAKTPITVGDIITALEAQFAAEPGAIREDALEFLENLIAVELLEISA